MKRTTALLVAAGGALWLSGPALGQTQYTWNMGIGSCFMGNCLPYWNESGNWTTSSWAGAGDRVVIDSAPQVQFIWFQLHGFPAHSGLVPTTPAELVIGPGRTLHIVGEPNYLTHGAVQIPLGMDGNTIINDGLIIVRNGVPTAVNGLYFGNGPGVSNPSITGSGTIMLDAAVSSDTELATFGSYVTFAGTWLPVDHGAGHTIKGIGTVWGEINNSGTILNDSGSLNRPLRVRSPAIVQTATGLIRADGTNTSAEVHLVGDWSAGMRITGGTIGGTGGRVIRVFHPDTVFEQLTIDGLIQINGGVQTLTCRANIVNDGEMTLTGGPGGVDGHTLAIDGDATWTSTTGGAIRLGAINNIAPRAKIVPVTPGDVLTIGASCAIRGNGEVRIELNNQGTVSADVSNADLYLLDPSLLNSGSLLAESGGHLRLESVGVTQSSLAMIRGVGTNSEVLLMDGTVVTGGRVGGTSDGAVVGEGGSTINTLTIDGLVQIATGGTVISLGNMTNTGTVQFPASFSATQLQLADSCTWSGAGQIVLDTFNNGVGHANLGYSDPANVLTSAASHTIRGNGDITVRLNNQGTVSADKGPNWPIRLRDQDKDNNATMQAVNGARLRIDAITITQSPTGRIIGRAGASAVDLDNGPTIIGGTVGTEGDGVFEGNDGSRPVLDGVRTTGTVGVPVARELEIRGTIANDGQIIVHPPVPVFNFQTKLHRSGPVTVTGNGRIVVNSFSSSPTIAQLSYDTLGTDIFTNAGGHRLEGKGGLHGHFVNQATIAPGSDYVNHSDLTGRFIMVDGGIDCQPSSTIEIQIASTAFTGNDEEFDRIVGQAGTTFQCDGELILENINGFTGLSAGEFLDIIVAPGGVTGTFDTVTSLGGASYTVVYMSDRVRLEQGTGCYADCDASGSLNILDYICFGDDYANGGTYADCDGSGGLNILDFICFGDGYAAGCP